MAVVTDLSQIELTRDVLGFVDDAENSRLKAMVAVLSSEKWIAQTDDNDLWEANRDDVTIINGKVSIDPSSLLARIRIRSLKRFGYSGVLTAAGEAVDFTVTWGTGVVTTTVRWF